MNLQLPSRFDAEELFTAEERDRRMDDEMDDEDFVDELNSGQSVQAILKYELHEDELKSQLYKATAQLEQMESEQPTDMTSTIQQNRLKAVIKGIHRASEVLKWGLTRPVANVHQIRTYEYANIRQIGIVQRWQLYNLWVSRMLEKVKNKLGDVEHNFEQGVKAWQEIKDQEYLYVMRNAAVVGITTTGAAQCSSILQALQPRIGKLNFVLFIKVAEKQDIQM